LNFAHAPWKPPSVSLSLMTSSPCTSRTRMPMSISEPGLNLHSSSSSDGDAAANHISECSRAGTHTVVHALSSGMSVWFAASASLATATASSKTHIT
jgi:hypothetical protein